MSQWSSYFAEKGLGVSKTLGDLLGPCAFALTMGLSRLIYGKLGSRMNVQRFIVFSAVLCVASYLLTVFAPHPILSLVGCGGGPGLVGVISNAAKEGMEAIKAIIPAGAETELKVGMLFAILFPIGMIAGMALLKKMTAKTK